MKLIKKSLTKGARLDFLVHAVKIWLQQKIEVHNHETKSWHIEFFSLRDRFDIFLGDLETFVLGYVWGLEE